MSRYWPPYNGVSGVYGKNGYIKRELREHIIYDTRDLSRALADLITTAGLSCLCERF